MSDPWLKFWVGCWLRDSALRICSRGARGLWMDMLCVMHQDGQPYGHLSLSAGHPMDLRTLVSLVGGPASEVQKQLKELAKHNVYSTTEAGVIFSRKMIRDQAQRTFHQSIGAKGAMVRLSRTPPTSLKCDTNHGTQVGTQVPSLVPTQVSTQVGTQVPLTSYFLPLTSSGGSGGPAPDVDVNEAHIPSVAEVVEFGGGTSGIPADYCAHYHAVCSEKQRWTGGFGRPILWRKEIVRWWAQARHSWQKKRPGEQLDKKAARDSLEAEMQWQKDPVRYAELRQKMRELRALEGGE